MNLVLASVLAHGQRNRVMLGEMFVLFAQLKEISGGSVCIAKRRVHFHVQQQAICGEHLFIKKIRERKK